MEKLIEIPNGGTIKVEIIPISHSLFLLFSLFPIIIKIGPSRNNGLLIINAFPMEVISV